MLKSKKVWRLRCWRGGAVMITATLILAGCGGGGGGGGNESPPPPGPGASANELNVTITDASIDDNGRPVVTYFVTDRRGDPLTASTVRTRFVIAARGDDSEFRDYITTTQTSPVTMVAATQASFEDSSAGTIEDLGRGLFRYSLKKTLPASFKADAVHRVGIFADTTVLGVPYVSNAIFDFVPSGGPVPATEDAVRTENCNTCHDPLEAHGGARRDVRLCVACHSSDITDFSTGVTSPQIDPDTGHNIGFRELIHKIHAGENLPSVEAGMQISCPT